MCRVILRFYKEFLNREVKNNRKRQFPDSHKLWKKLESCGIGYMAQVAQMHYLVSEINLFFMKKSCTIESIIQTALARFSNGIPEEFQYLCDPTVDDEPARKKSRK